MKRNKISAIIWFITNFSSEGSMGVVYICLGSTFLCLDAVWLNDRKDDDNK